MLCVTTQASAFAGATAHARIGVNASDSVAMTVSATETLRPKTRVWGFDQFAPLRVSAFASVSLELLRGFSSAPTELVSGASYQAEGSQIAGVASEMTPLFRAVGDAELGIIQSSGGRIPPSLYGMDVKYFSSTAEGAASYARQAVQGFGDAPYTIVETSIPQSLMSPDWMVQVDRGVSAVVVPMDYLGALTNAVPWNYMPIPGVQ
jgi:hypothetical protein